MAPNQEMEDKLEEVWVYLSNAMAERGARLSVALMFYQSAEMVGIQIVDRPVVLGHTHNFKNVVKK